MMRPLFAVFAVSAVLSALLAVGCGEGPGVNVVITVFEGDPADDTSGVKGLLLRVGQTEVTVAADRAAQEVVELKNPPPGQTEVVVFACAKDPCTVDEAEFVGCNVAILAASDETVAVEVGIFPVLSPDPDCVAFINGE